MIAPRQALQRVAGQTPLLAATALYLAITVVAVMQSLNALGEPIYGLDDAHIHMAMARNLAQYGVYGVTPFETTHASSSPLWVLLLAAGFAIFGPWYWWPGLLAALSAIAALAVAARYLRHHSPAPPAFADRAAAGFVLCVIVAGASLPPLTLQGMEHPLHAAMLLLAAWLGARAIAGQARSGSRDMTLVALCCLLPVLRYESLWLVALLAAGLVWRKRYGLAAGAAGAAALSVGVVGFWAMSKGLTFLPAPVLAKSVAPMLLSDNSLMRLGAKLVWHPLWRLGGVPMLAILFLAGVVFLAVTLWQRRWRALDDVPTLMAGLFVAGAWLHASFATFGWGGRYEAYLLVLGTTALGTAALQLRHRLDAARRLHRLAGLLAGLTAALAIYTALGRAQTGYVNAQRAAVEVLNRDFYVGRFLAAAYPHQSVLAMNIGAVVWAGEPRLLDPVALGTPAILPLIFERRFGVDALAALARQREVKVFAVFDDWFVQWVGGSPPWLPVARLDASTDRRPIFLTLYARDETEGRALAERLQTVRPAGNFDVKLKLLPLFE